ncbi:hypothetical protein Csa_015999 [Cucumis sativus]|uniref:Uncharacterized protein n=1 Tax=Cucumis sativus TaxID=3659 RepID=A0A0A0K5X9_CUCSA|nr:hypothetical protein Csa_015999 [Cucumis sativus]
MRQKTGTNHFHCSLIEDGSTHVIKIPNRITNYIPKNPHYVPQTPKRFENFKCSGTFSYANQEGRPSDLSQQRFIESMCKKNKNIGNGQFFLRSFLERIVAGTLT